MTKTDNGCFTANKSKIRVGESLAEWDKPPAVMFKTLGNEEIIETLSLLFFFMYGAKKNKLNENLFVFNWTNNCYLTGGWMRSNDVQKTRQKLGV